MKQISKWAANNVKLSKSLSIVLSTLLIGLGLLYGKILLSYDINIPEYFKYILIGIIFLTTLFYPFISLRKRKISPLFKYSYKRQKFHDFVLIFSTFLIAIFIANNSYEQKIISSLYATESNVSVSENTNTIELNSETKVPTIIKKAKSLKPKWHTWKLILLSTAVFIVAIGLAGLVASWACQLSCSGFPVAANVVAIVGFSSILLGGVVIIRKLILNYRKKELYIEYGKEKPTKLYKRILKYIAIAVAPFLLTYLIFVIGEFLNTLIHYR